MPPAKFVTKPCEFCGKEVTKNYNQARGRMFWTCGATCSNKQRIRLGHTARWTENPYRGQQETRLCPSCQTPITRYLKPTNINQEWTCSRSCKAKRQGQAAVAAGTWKQPVKKRRGETTHCGVCGQSVYRSKSTRANGEGKFCSRECVDKYQARNKTTLECAYCKKSFQIAPSQAANGRKFCSRSCESESRIKTGIDRIHNGRPVRLNQHGYLMLFEPEHPKNFHGWVAEHRLVMEKSVGRYLVTADHVHHINGDKQDNRIENLQLMSANDHRSLTQIETREKREAIRAERDALKVRVAELEELLRNTK